MSFQEGLLCCVPGSLNLTEPTVGGSHRQVLKAPDQVRKCCDIAILSTSYDRGVVWVRHIAGQSVGIMLRRPDSTQVGYP